MCMRKQMMNMYLSTNLQHCAQSFNHYESMLAEGRACLRQCTWLAPSSTCSRLMMP